MYDRGNLASILGRFTSQTKYLARLALIDNYLVVSLYEMFQRMKYSKWSFMVEILMCIAFQILIQKFRWQILERSISARLKYQIVNNSSCLIINLQALIILGAQLLKIHTLKLFSHKFNLIMQIQFKIARQQLDLQILVNQSYIPSCFIPLTSYLIPQYLEDLKNSILGKPSQMIFLIIFIIKEIHQNWTSTMDFMESGSKVETEQVNDQKSKYTIVPIEQMQFRHILEKYIKTKGKLKLKSSLCRFYLRGICIMKPECCKFAHSIKQLNLDEEDAMFYVSLSEKEKKKREFVEKRQFNQPALFILKNVGYHILYHYQFSQRYKNSQNVIHTVETISKDRGVRIRIRQIMHRQNWDGFLDYLQHRFPNTNFPISFVSFWYANFGFDKPQTRSKFGDFLKYSMFVRKYVQVDILFPPSAKSAIYLINSHRKATILEKNVEELYQICMKQKQQEGKEKMQRFLQRTLPEQLSKKYFCRYFMAGYCQVSSSQCLYAHSIEQLKQRYQLGQEFPPQYRQPVLPIQVRMSYKSLFQATRKYGQYKEYSQEDLNLNSTVRNQLRHQLHYELFKNFMQYLEDQLFPNIERDPQQGYKPFTIQLKDLQRYYQGAGFNHTNENKFQHLESSLWDLGYFMQDIVVKDEATLEKKKTTIVTKIPPVKQLNILFKKLILESIEQQLNGLKFNGVILESALKRTIYSIGKHQILPLHVYLRFRNITFQEAVKQICSEQQIQQIFFQSGEENIKKIAEIVRKYAKKNRKYVTSLSEIQSSIRSMHKEQLNFNHLVNFKTVIQSTLLELGKLIYFWPFDNNAFMVDPTALEQYRKKAEKNKIDRKIAYESFQQFQARIIQNKDKFSLYLNQRIIVVDNQKKLQYAILYLQTCGVMGVDLEGKLRVNGYIDLIQISGAKGKNNKIQHKQIFIFDIFFFSKQYRSNQELSYNLYQRAICYLREIFENSRVVKVMHDCRQDSVALKHILNIQIANVFDTSGFDVYLGQKQLYRDKSFYNTLNLLRRIYEVKVPGLNTILDVYKAPNGINIFKDSMKKKFSEPNNRYYFQQRPIDQQFLQYSARDVQDLIEVYKNMIQFDDQLLSEYIGDLYSNGQKIDAL